MVHSVSRRTPASGPRAAGQALLILGLTLATWFGGLQITSAQGQQPVVQSATLRLWPEYDDPGLLVIAAGTFGQDLTYPLDVAFPIPPGARSIQATVDDPSQGLMNRDWEIKDGRLSYSLPLPGYHYEYYVDRPNAGNARDITYTFQAPYQMKTLEVAVQQPARSTGFTVTPAPDGSYVGGDGFTYFTFKRDNLEAGERLDVNIRYNKTDDSLSTVGATALGAASLATPALAQAQIPAAAPAATGVPTWLVWGLIVAGAALALGAIAYWLYQQRQPATGPALRPTTPAAPRSAGAETRRTATAPTAAAVFCTQCGRRLNPDDRFCASCGTLRQSRS